MPLVTHFLKNEDGITSHSFGALMSSSRPRTPTSGSWGHMTLAWSLVVMTQKYDNITTNYFCVLSLLKTSFFKDNGMGQQGDQKALKQEEAVALAGLRGSPRRSPMAGSMWPTNLMLAHRVLGLVCNRELGSFCPLLHFCRQSGAKYKIYLRVLFFQTWHLKST